METTIDKKTFKLTYGQAVGLIVSIISFTITIYSFVNNSNSKIDKLEAKVSADIQTVNSKLEIVSITQTNQYKSTKNDRRRDSADVVNRFKSQDEKLEGIIKILDKINPYTQRSVTSK